MKPLTAGQIVRFIRQTFILGMSLSVVVYTWVRLLLFEAPVQFTEEATNLFKVIGMGWLLIMLLKGCFYAMLAIGEFLPRLMSRNKFVAPVLLFLATGGVLILFMW